MVKRFYKGKRYTLCLIDNKEDFTTFTVNVTFQTRIGSVLQFVNEEGHYIVDIDPLLSTHLVNFETEELQEITDLAIFGDTDPHLEMVTAYHFYTLANIVQGWQW